MGVMLEPVSALPLADWVSLDRSSPLPIPYFSHLYSGLSEPLSALRVGIIGFRQYHQIDLQNILVYMPLCVGMGKGIFKTIFKFSF